MPTFGQPTQNEPWEEDVEASLNDWDMVKKFRPKRLEGFQEIFLNHPQYFIAYNEEKDIRQLNRMLAGGNGLCTVTNSLVIEVGTSFRQRGLYYNPRASWGVWVGPESAWNKSGILSRRSRQSRFLGQIKALGHAITIIENICARNPALTKVKVATDCRRLVRTLTKKIQSLTENRGRRIGGKKKVEHYKELKQLHERMMRLNRTGVPGFELQLWNAPPEFMKRADKLADLVLDKHVGPKEDDEVVHVMTQEMLEKEFSD